MPCGKFELHSQLRLSPREYKSHTTTMAAETDEFAKSSDRICTHMNDDHAASVLGMAMMVWPKARRARMVALKADAVVLAAADADGSSTRSLSLPLDPPLASPGDARPRLVEIHKVALAPALDMPLAGVLAALMAVLFAAAFTDYLPAVTAFFAVAFPDGDCVRKLVYFTCAVHSLEALYAAYLARSLKLGFGACAGWGLAALAVGVGALNRIVPLANAKTLPKAAKLD